MNIIKIEGKSLEKLLDVVSKGIGVLYKPRSIRKEAEAEAYKQEILSIANAKSLLIEGKAKLELIDSAKARLVTQEINRQLNIENIVEKSIPYLKNEISEDPVDKDWRTRFFKKAQDVSNEDMQNIWAQILAEEVASPGKVSMRTLNIVSILSKVEAELFQVACSLASQFRLIYKLKSDSALELYGLKYFDLMNLREAGLLHESDSIIEYMPPIEQLGGVPLLLGGKTPYYIIKSKNKISLEQLPFTQAGRELCLMLNVESNEEYLASFVAELQESYAVESAV